MTVSHTYIRCGGGGGEEGGGETVESRERKTGERRSTEILSGARKTIFYSGGEEIEDGKGWALKSATAEMRG